MKTITLNIGLDTNDGGKLAIHGACNALQNADFEVINSRVANSPNGDEQTLVVLAKDSNDALSKCYRLAVWLKQDCIAIHDGEKGELIGPNAAKWGEFNPEFFVHFDEPSKPCDSIKRDGFTRYEFTQYLTQQLIPDLQKSGFEATAKDFETAVQFIISID